MRHSKLRCARFSASILVVLFVACTREPAPPTAAAAAAQTSSPSEVKTAVPPVIAPDTGSIEGTITDTNGTPPVTTGPFGGTQAIPIVLKADGNDLNTESDPKGGGFFAFRNLKPGLYELFIEAAHPPGSSEPLRPVHVSGIAVEAGKRTVLKVRMEPGKELQEIGKPAMSPQKFVVVSEELERLQAQIDELKKK
jgi:hypothetical protein